MNSDLVRWLLDVDSIPQGAERLDLSFEHPMAPWLWLLLLGAAFAFAFWSYSRLAGPRGARLVLAAARFVLIVLVLLVVSGPMLEYPRETLEQDWVLVLADRSRSMQIADAALDGQRASRDRQLGAAIESHADMWRRLAAGRRVVWLGFHGGAFNLQASPRDPVSGAATAVVELGEPSGERTSLGRSLEQALQQAAARPLSGVVVLSDGRTADPPERALLRRLQQDAVPVFTIPLGSAEPIGDVAIRRVQAPRRAFVRDKVPVVVEVERLGEGVAGTDLNLTLRDTVSGETLDEVHLAAGEEAERLTLTAQPSLSGEANWEVIVETGRPDLIPENNLEAFQIELVDRPLRVLYVEGYPRWEYRYVKNLLVREKSIDSSVMLLSADRDFAQEGNQPITRVPRSPEEFAQFDVIILGDVPGTFFSPDQLDVIRDQVAQRGTGILWIAGERDTPRSYAGTVLADLLPIRGSLTLAPIGQPVTMQPTDLAERLGVLLLSLRDEVLWPRELSEAATGWSRLFYAQRLEPGRLKPTAEVLAETVQEFDGAPLPLVVHMRYGAGQSIFVATDEIWRWRYGRGEHLPEQFWIQMIRMLGRETLVSGGEQAILDVIPRRVAVQQPVRIDLRVLDAQVADARRTTVRAVIESADGQSVAELELRRAAGGEERYSATYLPGMSGTMRVTVAEPDLASLQLSASFEAFTPEDELRRPETDHGLLEDLASATGGRMLEPQELSDLEQLLPNRSVRTINPLSERLWDTPLCFILLVLLITIEWIGRKVIRLS